MSDDEVGNVLSSGLGAAGAAHAVAHGGRRFEFRPFGQAMMDEFQKELYRDARDRAPKLPEVADAAPGLRDAALERVLKRLERQFLSGGFEMESEAGQEFMSRKEGQACLFQLIVSRPPGCDDAAYVEFVKARKVEIAVLIDQVLTESCPAYARLKARAAAGGAPGPAEGNARTPPATSPPGAMKSCKKRGKKGKKTRR